MFEKGDKVILLDNYAGEGVKDWCKAGGLVPGEVYTVKAKNGRGVYMEESIEEYIYNFKRFELATDLREAEEF